MQTCLPPANLSEADGGRGRRNAQVCDEGLALQETVLSCNPPPLKQLEIAHPLVTCSPRPALHHQSDLGNQAVLPPYGSSSDGAGLKHTKGKESK